MSDPRTLFVGDLHGCADEFEQILGTLEHRPGHDRLLLAGDAFARGPRPRRVWELIGQAGAEMVLGNHDDRLLRQARAHAAGESPHFKHDQRVTFDALEPVLDELLPWLEALPLCLDEPDYLLVHAGIDPEAGRAGTTREQFLTIRTWPPVEGLDGPRWHDVIEPPPDRPIVFGHDAPGGLVVKRRGAGGPPWLVGLDSGCVYGGALSAWILEADRIVQVDSRQPGSS